MAKRTGTRTASIIQAKEYDASRWLLWCSFWDEVIAKAKAKHLATASK